MNLRNILLVAAMLSVALSVFGQDTVTDDAVCNDEFAKFIVDQQVSEGRWVAETDKRVRILTRSADFLWKFDQPKAREYFTEAFKVASDRFAEKGFEKKNDAGLTVQLPDYRFEVVKAIAKHDGVWARKLTEDLLKEYEKAAKDRDGLDKNRELNAIMDIAISNVASNPSLSWYLFRRVMREPADYHWMWALYSVDGKNKLFALQLYDELLRNYANELPSKLLFFSAYPFGRPNVFGFDRTSYSTGIAESFVGDLNLQARFLDTFLRRSDSYASDPANLNVVPEKYRQPEAVYIITALQELEPLVLQTHPAFLPRFGIVRSKAFAMLSDENKKSMDERDKWSESLKTPFEKRIADLEKAEEEGRLTDGMILGVLIHAGIKKEENFKIFETWLDKVVDGNARNQMVNYFWFLRSKLAIKEKRLADAEQFAKRVPEVEHQAILLFEIAEEQLKNMNDTPSAYQTLADVSKTARRAEDSVGKARVYLGLANLYEKLNHSFAISELSDAVLVINKLKEGDLLSSSVFRTIKTKDMSFFASFGIPNYDLEKTFQTTSKNDFSLPLSNAKAIDDKFYRTIAVIAIAKNCIDKPKKKAPVAAQ